MNNFAKLGVLAAFLLFGLAASAQTSTEDLLEKANKQYNLYAYNLAVRSYRSVLEQEPGNPEAIGKLADCYRQLNQPDEAVKWYERAVVVPGASASILLHYGKTLASLGRYDDAKKQFLRYATGNEMIGNHFATACDFAKAHADDAANFAVKNEAINTASSDFGAAFFNKNVIFSSSRNDMARKADKKSASDWTGDAYNQLFLSSRDAKGFLGKPAFLKSDLENNFNEGPVSFSADGERVAFCRNNFVDGSRQVGGNGVRMSLYLGELIDGKWANVKPFAFNGDFSTGYATFSPDGKTLFYASDREGGFGGWDIYASTFNGKTWNTPENLGSSVNTPGDEITPFYDGKSLFFASDWHDGFGGMDIFKAETDGGEFKKIKHLGPGINSSRDDYGFVFDEKMNLGYLTSNRKGSKGNEDIWQVSRATEAYSISVVADKKPLAGAEIDFSACNGGKVLADKSGLITFDLLEGTTSCSAVIRKSGYEAVAVEVFSGMKTRSLLVEMRKRAEGSDASVERTPPAPVTFSTETAAPAKGSTKNFDGQYVGRVQNADTKGFLENVAVIAKMQPDGKPFTITTDAEGRFGFDLEPGKTYKITASRAGFAEESMLIKADAKAKDLGSLKLRDAYAAAGNPVKQSETAKLAETAQPAEAKKEAEKAAAAVVEKKETKSDIVVFKPEEKANETAVKPVVFSTENKEKANEPAGFSVQVASIDGRVDNDFLKKYANLSGLGNLYAQPEGKTSKIRVGIFTEKAKAETTMAQALKLGYKGAFIVAEKERKEQLVVGQKVAETKIAETKVAETKTVETKVTEAKTAEIVAKPAQPVVSKPVEHSTTTAKTPEIVAEKPPVKEEEPPIFIIANKKEEAPAPKVEEKPAPPKRWSVQVAALTNQGEAVDMSAYAPLFEIGNVYTIPEKTTTKVRVGVWENKADADKAEAAIQSKGFKDALVVEEKAVYRTEKMVIKPKTAEANATKPTGKAVKTSAKTVEKVAEKPVEKPTVSPYKVRVASVRDMKKYDETQVADFGGTIEKVKKGKVTVIYLSNFPNLETAIVSKNNAIAGGFDDAFIVKIEAGKEVKVAL